MLKTSKNIKSISGLGKSELRVDGDSGDNNGHNDCTTILLLKTSLLLGSLASTAEIEVYHHEFNDDGS